MQPRPRAETFRPLRPSSRVCIVVLQRGVLTIRLSWRWIEPARPQSVMTGIHQSPVVPVTHARRCQCNPPVPPSSCRCCGTPDPAAPIVRTNAARRPPRTQTSTMSRQAQRSNLRPATAQTRRRWRSIPAHSARAVERTRHPDDGGWASGQRSRNLEIARTAPDDPRVARCIALRANEHARKNAGSQTKRYACAGTLPQRNDGSGKPSISRNRAS